MITLLNLSVLGFSFVFHDKAKRTQQENMLNKIGQVCQNLYRKFVTSSIVSPLTGVWSLIFQIHSWYRIKLLQIARPDLILASETWWEKKVRCWIQTQNMWRNLLLMIPLPCQRILKEGRKHFEKDLLLQSTKCTYKISSKRK